MYEPELWPLQRVFAAATDNALAWCDPSVRAQVEGRFHGEIHEYPDQPPEEFDFLLAVGGGKVLDAAKSFRAGRSPGAKLVAIPSIWGSGAENSNIVVTHGPEGATVFQGPEYLPDIRAVWPELAASLTPDLVRNACGDVWAHALEGSLSPLGDEELKAELAKLIRTLLDTPIANRPEWFELSARACILQSRAGVGLVHGIAHALEGALIGTPAATGHAALCATFLLPVFRLNHSLSEKVDAALCRSGLDPELIESRLKELFDQETYSKVLPTLEERWLKVLRDPCTRMNCALVRPGHLDHFLHGVFP